MKHIVHMIKLMLTSKVTLNNVLGEEKFSKETHLHKENICVLGVSKL